MCGITGYVFLDRNRNIDPNVLRSMTESIEHRGPDDEGFHIDRNVGLGFRRLSIIDLNTGHQPLSNADDTVHIVFNGEIYNYLEYRELLKKKGYQFKTATDTEVILHLYEEYGSECLQYLRGMFGFVIWDSRKQVLFCARDRFGIKPFYYYLDQNIFVFGSEIKTLLAGEPIDTALSMEALDSYFAFGYITHDLSIYKHIRKLQPGHYLTLDLSKKPEMKIARYWDIRFEPDYSRTEQQWEEEMEQLLSETVKMHMISDVPLGAFLSGGIDSSSVVALMAKNSNRPVKTFSIGFKEEKFNELVYAREVAQMYQTEHHEQIVEPASISLLPDLVKAYDEPFADASAIPTYYVSKIARENVTVALSGDGGDELFAGYNIYKYLRKLHEHPLNISIPGFNKLFWGSIYKMIPWTMKGKGAAYFLSRSEKYMGAFLSSWNIDERKKLFLSDHNSIDSRQASELFKKSVMEQGSKYDFITNLQYLDLQTYMVDDVLTKVDRASMMNSLEVRVPLLDHKVAELSFRIPWNLKYHETGQKYIFKQTMKPHLPASILQHPKQGFGVPLSYWFKDDLKQYINDTLVSSTPLLAEYLNLDFVRKTVNSNHNAMRDFSGRIWQLIVFEEWLRNADRSVKAGK
jgi:asparagine synthase (glutamine-hydrolysing)